MKTKEEALDYLVSAVAEIIEVGDAEDAANLDRAAQILRAPSVTVDAEMSAEAIKSLMQLIENGAAYHGALYEKLNVKLRLSTDPKERSGLAIALSEVAGATSALGSILGHVLGDDADRATSMDRIFSGKGLTYPKVLKQTGSTLILPGR